MKTKILPFCLLIFLAFFLLISCDLSSDKNAISQATETEGTEEATEFEEVTEPEATEPEVTEPEATEPVATEPEATEPEATEPAATEPAATETEVTEPEATEPEVTEPVATEPAATETEVTEPEATEPEESESETRPVYADKDFNDPNYVTLSHFEGAVVRWGDVIDGEITDSEGTGEASSNIFDLLSDDYTTFFVAVNVEVLDVVEHKASKPEKIYNLETILIPRLAMPLVTTGEVSLVFFYYSEIYAEDGTSVWIAWVEHALKKLINYPIFDFVDGHMMISDSQMQECLSEEWTSTFLRSAWRISQRCTKVGLNYKFYSGMTIDEWEVFYQKARDLGI